MAKIGQTVRSVLQRLKNFISSVGDGFVRLVKVIARILWWPFRQIYKVIRPTWWKVAIFNILIIAFTALFYFTALAAKPDVVANYPEQDETWTTLDKPIQITFDRPFNKDELEFNMAPDIPGKVHWERSFAHHKWDWLRKLSQKLPLYQKLYFTPHYTVEPERKVVVYLTGIQDYRASGKKHERSIEFYGPERPQIASLSIADQQTNVLPDKDIDYTFTSPNGPFMDWQFVFEPEVEYEEISRSNHLAGSLHIPDMLQQGKQYTLDIQSRTQTYDMKKAQILEYGEYESVKKVTFTTVKAPGIDKISPSGDGVLVDVPLLITFSEPMATKTVEEAFSIEPAAEGEVSWQDDRILTYSFAQQLTKDKTYKVKIDANIKTKQGGILRKPIEHKFETIGPIEVAKVIPSNGLGGVSVATNIVVSFNQDVDTKSAQQNFTISPGANGAFSWKGKNQLTFNPSGYLAYSRKYTVTLKKGIKSVHGLPSAKDYSFSFTTAPQTVILNVPQYSQQETFTCNVASIRMALAYRGVYRSEGSIKSGIGIGPSLDGSTGGDPNSQWIDRYGVHWGPARSYIANFRTASVKRSWSISGLTSEIAKGNPVILWWHNGWSEWKWKSWTTPGGYTVSGLNGMHSEVAVGFKGPASSPTHIITRDPWRGTRTYTVGYFDNLWNSTFGRTGVVVY